MGEKDKYRNLKDLAYYSSLGLSVALSIFIGLFLGVWLDKKFETTPVLTLVGLGMGIVAGFRNLARAAKKSRRM
ncbi:MAG: AtpZ/AtpI family protein [Desulfobacteraceae bacterium]